MFEKTSQHTHKHTGVVQGSKSAESLSANNFKKSLLMGGKDYMAEFRKKFGDTAAGNLLRKCSMFLFYIHWPRLLRRPAQLYFNLVKFILMEL